MFLVSSFIKSKRHNFIASNEWCPVYPTSVHWIIRLRGNAGVLLQAVTDAKNSFQVYRCTLADLVCLAGESHRQRCERQQHSIVDGFLWQGKPNQLQAGVSASDGNFEHVMWQFV